MLKILGVSLLYLFISAGCTREGKSTDFRISVPNQAKVGALSTTYRLQIAIANLHIPGSAPMVARIETHDGELEVAYGTQLDFTFKNVPSGKNGIVQVLTVYKGVEDGDTRYFFGDKPVTISGETNVAITTAAVGVSSGKEAHLAGQYLTNASGGPTGKILTLFETGAGKPAMTIESDYMVNGWFQAFAVQGVKFDIVLEDSGTVLFDDLTVNGAGNVSSVQNSVPVEMPSALHRLILNKPVTYSQRAGDLEPRPAAKLLLGYFDSAGDANASDNDRKVLYPSTSIGISNSFVDSSLNQIVNYMGSGGGLADITVSGGEMAAISDMWSWNTSACNESHYDAGTCQLFSPTRLSGGGDDGVGGFEVPFRSIKPGSTDGGYLDAMYSTSCTDTSPCLKLAWDLLPGTAAELSGVELWMKNVGANGGGGDDHDLKCSELPSKGYSLQASVSPITEAFEYSSGINSSNYHQFQFFACARSTFATGRKYVSRPVRSDNCTGSCNDLQHLGWSLSGTGNISSIQFHSSSRRVTAIDPTLNRFMTRVTLGSSYTGEFLDADEVMIHVSGKGGAMGCGSVNGSPVQPGQFSFAKVLGRSDSIHLDLEKGTLLDSMSGLTSELTNSATAATFCFVQVVKVKHYNHLVMNGGASLSPSTFNYSGNGGGILPIRVSGKLSMGSGSEFSAAAKGYTGGAANNHGASWTLDANGTTPGDGSGEFGTYGGGGGGYGRGGQNAGGGAGGDGSPLSNGMLRLMMGAGGGGNNISQSGAVGGGIVFLMANEIETNGTNLVSAQGGAGNTDTGGGGGGSTFVFARQVTGGGVLVMDAKGGNTSNGGVGGGGSITDLLCSLSAPVSRNADKGTGMDNLSLAGSGMSSSWDATNSYICNGN